MTNYLVFVAVFASLVLYILVARSSRGKPGDTPDDYYLSPNSVDASQYSASQTAYQLQMQTIYPFFILAFTGLWWVPVLNVGFYTFGILIYTLLIPYFRRGVAPILSTSRTMHAAIANLNNLPSLRLFTALLTVIAFSGLAMFEIAWGAGALKLLFDGSSLIYYIAIAILTAYLIIYIWIGGQRATIRADQYLLLFSYVGLHALVVWVVWNQGVDIAKIPFQIIVTAIAFVSFIMLSIRLWQIGKDLSPKAVECDSRQIKRPKFLLYLNILTVISLAAMLVSIIRSPSKLVMTVDPSTVIAAVHSSNFGIIAISVSCLPLFFQFVDMTDWQRTSSVRASAEDKVREVRRGLWQYLVESPLSWLLPIFIGLCAVQFIHPAANEDPWQALLNAVLQAPGPLGLILAMAVFVGIVAIFMSTANELLTAIGYTASFDIWPSTRRLSDRLHSAVEVDEDGANAKRSNAKIKHAGRVAFAIAATIVVAAFILVDIFIPGSGQQFIYVFLSFYSPLVAMAPSLMIPTIFGVRAHPWAVWLSLLLGSVGGLFFGVWSVFDPNALGGWVPWLSSPVSFGVAWGLYVAGLCWGSKVSIGAAQQASEGSAA